MEHQGTDGADMRHIILRTVQNYFQVPLGYVGTSILACFVSHLPKMHCNALSRCITPHCLQLNRIYRPCIITNADGLPLHRQVTPKFSFMDCRGNRLVYTGRLFHFLTRKVTSITAVTTRTNVNSSIQLTMVYHLSEKGQPAIRSMTIPHDEVPV